MFPNTVAVVWRKWGSIKTDEFYAVGIVYFEITTYLMQNLFLPTDGIKFLFLLFAHFGEQRDDWQWSILVI